MLEGAVPLSSIVPQEDGLHNGDFHPSPATKAGTSAGSTANRFARQLSPSAAARTAVVGDHQPPNSAVTMTHVQQQQRREQRSKPKDDLGGGFLSALVSLIETVASPITPERSRAGARRMREAAAIISASAGSFSEVDSGSTSSSVSSSPKSTPAKGQRARQPAPPSVLPATNGDRAGNRAAGTASGGGGSRDHSGSAVSEMSSSSSSGSVSQIARRPDPNRAVPQRGFGAGATADGASGISNGRSSNPRGKLQRGFGSSVSTVSSTDAGEEDEAMPLQRGFGASGTMKRGFPSEDPMKRGFGPR